MRHVLVGINFVILSAAAFVFSQTRPSIETTPLTFHERYLNSGRAAINDAGGRPRAMTNVRKVEEEIISTIKAASPQTLQKPTTVASRYMPKMQNGIGIFINWIEDHPSLRKVTVRNPETREEIRLIIPQERLDEIRNSGGEEGFIYGWFTKLPEGFVKGNSQVLEVSAPDQDQPANVYPSIFVDQDVAPSTQPATQPGN